jgi:PAS domain S-box-containing protein
MQHTGMTQEQLVREVTTLRQRLAELEAAETERRQAVELYRTLVHTSPDAVTVTDLEGSITFVSPRTLELHGFDSEEELLGKSALALIAPEDRDLALANMQETLQEGFLRNAEYTLLRKDGTRFAGGLDAALIPDAEGKPDGFIATTRNITELRRVAEEVRRLKEFNEGIVQNMSEGIVVQDAGGNFGFVNPAAATLLGYTPRELLGQPWTAIIPPDQQPIAEAADERRMEGQADRYEVELLRKDGSRVPVLISGSPRFDADTGRFSGTLAVFTDIAERSRAEEKLARRAREMAALYETSLEINAQPDLSALLHAIVRRAAGLLGARMGGLYLVQPSGQALELVISHNLPGRYVGSQLRLGEGLSGRIAQTGKPMMVADYGAWKGRASVYGDHPFRRVLGVPLTLRDRVIGVINVTDDEQVGPFDEDEIRLVSLFADQAVVAIENARLLEAEAHRRREAEALQAATQALTATLDLQQVLASILSELRPMVPYDSASVQQLAGDQLEIIGGHGFPNLEQLLGIRFDLGAGDNPNQEVVRTRAPLILDDAPALYSQFKREPHAPAGIRSWLGVPLLFGDRLIGMIALDKREPGFYSVDHARVAMAFAAQAAIAIENARLFQETRQRIRELALLFKASTAISTSLDVDTVLQATAQQVTAALAVDACALSAWDRDQNSLVMLLDYVTESLAGRWKPDPPGTIYPLEEYPSSRQMLAGRQPLVVQASDPEAEPRTLTWMKHKGVQSLLMVPLVVRDRAIGALELMQVGAERAFTPTEISLCQTLANQAAAALENAQLFQAERDQRELAERLRETALLVNSSLDLQEVLELILDQLARVLPYYSGTIQILEPDATRVLAVRNLPSNELGHRYPLDEYPYNRRLAKAKQPTIIRDVQADAQGWKPSVGLDHVRANIGVPLRVRDRVIGMLTIDSRQPGAYGEADARIAQTFAQQAAIAIENARLFQAERGQRELAEALREAARVMGTSLELDEILRLILDQLKRVLVYDTASVLIVQDENVPDLVVGVGYSDERLTSHEARHLLRDSPILRRMARDLQPVLSADVRQLDGWVWVPGAQEVRSWLGIPLIVHGRMIGALMVDHAQPGFYGEAEMHIAQALAQHAAQAIENARLFQAEREQRELAEALQQAAAAVSSTLDLDQVLDHILEQVSRVIPSDAANINLIEEGCARMVRWRGYEQFGQDVHAMALPVADTPTLRSMQETGETRIVSDTATSADWVDVAEAAWIRSYAGAPIRIRGEVIGFLNVDSAVPGFFTPDHTDQLRAFADQASLALANARLFEETNRRNQELALLNRVIAASAASPDIEATLQTVCQELALAFGLSQAVAVLLGEDRRQALVVADCPPDVQPSALGKALSLAGMPLFQDLLEQGAPLVADSAQVDARLTPIRDLARQCGVASLLLLPLTVEGGAVGSLILGTTQSRIFSAEEIDLAQRVADQVSSALARTRLEETQRRLSAAIEQAAEAVIITDTEGTILYVNPAFERIVGYRHSQVIGDRSRSLMDVGPDGVFHQELWRTVTAGEVWQERLENVRDDTTYTLDLTVAPVRNEAGEIVNYVGTMRDVSREVQLEKRFRQSLKMEALGRLAGGIAHDFNNLLTVIQLSVRLLDRQLHPEDPLWEHVRRIEETGERAAKLTKQLLSFSRREIIEPRILDLNEIVHDLHRMLQRIISEDIELTTTLAPDLWPAEVDLSQIEQVIMNLVINARDAMPAGGTLTIETDNVLLDEAYAAAHMDVQPGEHVRLTISDTGIGMDDEVKAHLFEPFFTTKKQGQGTGLGLSTVFGIVKQHKGHVQVYSEARQGTTVRIYLPRAGEAGTAATSPASAGPLSLIGGTETILVVEDEPGVRDLAVRVLTSCGYQVLAAGDGHQALEIAEEHDGPIHLLLADVILPRMNGKELADRFQAQRSEAQVLYMSGYTDDVITHHGVLAPGTAFLAKPFSVADLTKKVRAALDKPA